MAHLLAFQQASHKPKALLHHRTLFPRHRQFPPAIAGGNCYPCVRYELSPMSRAAHSTDSHAHERSRAWPLDELEATTLVRALLVRARRGDLRLPDAGGRHRLAD